MFKPGNRCSSHDRCSSHMTVVKSSLHQELSKMAVKSLLNGVEDKNDYYKFDEEIMTSGKVKLSIFCNFGVISGSVSL